jgi:hypothetical protein
MMTKKMLAILTMVAVLGSVGVAGAERQDGGRYDGREKYDYRKPGDIYGWNRENRPCRGDGWRGWIEKKWGERNDRRPGMRREGPWHGRGDRPRHGREGWMEWDGMRQWRRGLRKDAPEEIRSKIVELEKLRIDMREALSRDPIDREKALDVFEKMTALRREIAGWTFNRRLDALEKRQTERTPVAPSPTTSGDVAPRSNL